MYIFFFFDEKIRIFIFFFFLRNFACLLLVFFIFFIFCGRLDRVFIVFFRKLSMELIFVLMVFRKEFRRVLNNFCMWLLIIVFIGLVLIVM